MMNLLKKPRKKLKNPKHQDSVYRHKHLRIRLAHHKHTGKRLPFYCTSYAIVFFLLTFTSSVVLLATYSAKADQQQTGTVQLDGVVQGRPPEIPAKVTTPTNGTHFTDSQLEISGTCLQDKYIEIYRKGIFAGMTICSPEGTFKITITLVPGENSISVRTRDSLGQYGPNSEAITYFLDQKTSTLTIANGEALKPLLIYTDPVQKGLLVGQSVKVDYQIHGDEPPYSVVIDWGDGTPVTIIKHDKEGNYSSNHVYKDPGQRTIRISGIGGSGIKASIQTVIVVHSANAPISSTSSNGCEVNSFSQYCLKSEGLTGVIEFMWPAIVVASLMAGSFWIGEKITYVHPAVRRKTAK